MNRRLMNTILCAAGLVLTLSTPAVMAAWPDGKPISIVVPYAPGGTADALARLIAQHLGTKLSTSVVVVNKAGASGVIGAQAVSEGYRLLTRDAGRYKTYFPKIKLISP